MTRKITAAMLIATALPFSEAMANSGRGTKPGVTGYVYFMLALGMVYFLALVIRSAKRKQQAHIHSSNNKN